MKDRIKQMPIFVKAIEINELIQGLDVLLAENEDELLQSQREFLIENALIIPAKISSAESVALYDLKMENAAIIRKAAREIFVSVGSLKYLGLNDLDYIDLIREKVEEFKILFREWVKGFDPENYIFDDWGLFNPPGADA